MTKKHFIAMAEAFRREAETGDKATVARLAEAFADVAASTNPNFRRGQFLAACGL